MASTRPESYYFSGSPDMWAQVLAELTSPMYDHYVKVLICSHHHQPAQFTLDGKLVEKPAEEVLKLIRTNEIDATNFQDLK